MKKGFTLLELIIVIIIVGVLATLGFTQYGKMVEKSRGAEARTILGDLRKLAYAYRLEKGDTAVATIIETPSVVNIGGGDDQIPNGCRSSHYFYYTVAAGANGDSIKFTGNRCLKGGGGKEPGLSGDFNGSPNPALNLETDLVKGTDTWTGEYY